MSITALPCPLMVRVHAVQSGASSGSMPWARGGGGGVGVDGALGLLPLRRFDAGGVGCWCKDLKICVGGGRATYMIFVQAGICWQQAFTIGMPAIGVFGTAWTKAVCTFIHLDDALCCSILPPCISSSCMWVMLAVGMAV